MDYRKAIEYFERELNCKKMALSPLLDGKESLHEQYLKTAISAMQELQQYKQLGTLEEVREAVEKQNPKTPTYEGDGYADGSFVWDEWICPRCGISYEVDYDEYDYCPNCGQHIDWSDENEIN